MNQKSYFISKVNNEKGSTLLEHTFALPFFLIFLIVTFELLRVAFNQVSIQFVLARVMRQSTVLDAPVSTAAEGATSSLLTSLGLSFTSGVDQLTICPAAKWGNTTLCPPNSRNFGLSLEPVVYELRRNVTFFQVGNDIGLSLPTITLRAMAMGKNEPR